MHVRWLAATMAMTAQGHGSPAEALPVSWQGCTVTASLGLTLPHSFIMGVPGAEGCSRTAKGKKGLQLCSAVRPAEGQQYWASRLHVPQRDSCTFELSMSL